MNIQEMHLSVMQGVDKINAQVADTLLVGEIDRELNKSIQQFVSTRFQKNNKHMQGFEESQKRRDDLRTLIREVESGVVFKEIIRDGTHADGALYVDTWTIPEDYMHLINISAVINRLPDCSKISYQLEDQDEMFYFVLPFKDFVANGGTTYVDEIWIVQDIEQPWGGDDWVGNLVWTNTEWEDMVYPSNQQEIVDNIISVDNQAFASLEDFMFPIFWETWNNPNISEDTVNGNLGVYNFPGSLIIALNGENVPELNINADASLGPVTYVVGRYQNDTVVYNAIRFNNDTSHRRIPSTTDFKRETYSCRLVQHDDIFKLVDDPFNKMKYSSPLAVMRGYQLDIYSDNIYLADQIRLTYLKRPKIVSLADDINCDLPVSTHEEVCKFAVASILEEISDPRFNTHLMQVDKME